MATTSFPTSLSSEALLPVLTAQLGSEILAKQVIKTLENAAANEAKKKQQQQQQLQQQQQQQMAAASPPSISTSNATPSNHITNINNNNNNNVASVITHNHQRPSAFMQVTTSSPSTIIFPTPKKHRSSPELSPSLSVVTSSVAATVITSPSLLSTSNIQNVPPKVFSRPPSPTSSRTSFRQPSPSTSACSIRSTSSTINSDKPFAVNTRGRKRVYTDEERRLRKNRSSKKSREKHTEQVMEKKLKLQQLQDKHQDLVEKRQQLDKEIREHRQHLCPYCLNVVEEALREIGKGQDIVVLKRVNFCCSTYHAQQQQQQHPGQPKCHRSAAVGSNAAAGGDNDVIFDKIIKQEPSEFS